MPLRFVVAPVGVLILLFAPLLTPAYAAEVSVPVLVPVTGVFALEGGAQRNGALLAMRHAPKDVHVRGEVYDTAVAPDVGVQALERAISRDKPTAVVGSMIGVQLLAMLPILQEAKIPMLTTSGTARITELNNPWIFRFFPADPLAKEVHVRYVVEELKKRRIALVYQTTAYGQSGRAEIVERLKRHNLEPVMQEALEITTRDMSPTIGKIRAANPDVVMLHIHSQPTALFVRAAAQAGLGLPIVAGSAIHQPTTVSLVEPAELTGVCGETNASPISGETPEMRSFLDQYRKEFGSEPDGFAVGQYDGLMMMLGAVAKGARTPAEVQKALASSTYAGLAMTYKSDGKGNMAHSAVIICYDGKSRIPRVAKRYENVTGVLSR
ncbi:MAG TPA: ABC transporter substrate-binding protein [Gemmatimonadaceae bacterium]|nr:ABC transporter substrate-binding protein [Gemmatimonadaceae bacterium]